MYTDIYDLYPSQPIHYLFSHQIPKSYANLVAKFVVTMTFGLLSPLIMIPIFFLTIVESGSYLYFLRRWMIMCIKQRFSDRKTDKHNDVGKYESIGVTVREVLIWPGSRACRFYDSDERVAQVLPASEITDILDFDKYEEGESRYHDAQFSSNDFIQGPTSAERSIENECRIVKVAEFLYIISSVAENAHLLAY